MSNPHNVTIIVNGEEKEVPKGELAYDDIIDLAFNPRPVGDSIEFTITFRRGHGNKPEGTLVQGETVKVKDGMIFNVTPTDKS